MKTVPLLLEDGSPVVEYSRLRKKMHPKGYLPPKEGGRTIPQIDLFVIAVGTGIDNQPIYWLRGLDDFGNSVVGEMYYTLEAARNFLVNEYGVDDASWTSLD